MNEALYEQLKHCFLPIEIESGRKNLTAISMKYNFECDKINEHGKSDTSIILGKQSKTIDIDM